MKAKLKDLLSSDLDLRNYWPKDERNFGFGYQCSLGLTTKKDPKYSNC
ncbi:hypothetical protein [Herbaspirillum sp.]|nr:hypothetical protein [Herbaspirillum sp.]